MRRRYGIGVASAALLLASALSSWADDNYQDASGSPIKGVVPMVGCTPNGKCSGPVSTATPLPVAIESGGGGGGSVTQGTTPWVDNITQLGNVVLGGATAWGVAPSGNVIGVNANVLTLPALAAGANTIGAVTIAGPLGASQASPTTPISVTDPDDFAVSGSVTSAGTLFTQDMLGYNSVTVEITANASANTITFETSDDNTNWSSVSGLISASIGTSLTTVSTAASAVSLYRFPKAGRYFRARVSTFVSGTTTVVGNLHKYVVPNLTAPSALLASTVSVGKVAPGYTTAQTPASNSSGVVANASAVATLTGVSAKSTYLTGFDITSDGATVGSCVNPTVTGLLGGTRTYTYCVPAGVTAAATPLVISFVPPLISSTTATNIVVTLPALGAGSTTATVNAQGYVE